MTKALLVSVIGVWLLAPASASASLEFRLDSKFNGTAPPGEPPWLTAVFYDHSDDSTIAVGDVRLTLTANLTGDAYISRFAFNVVETIDPGSVIVTDVTAAGGAARSQCILQAWDQQPQTIPLGNRHTIDLYDVDNIPGFGPDCYSSGWDFLIAWNTLNWGSNPRFDGSEQATFTLTGQGLTAESFRALNYGDEQNNGVLYVAAKVQGYGASGAIGELWTGGGHTPPPVVPEPSTYLVGAALLLPFGLSVFRTTRRNRKA